MPRCGAAIEIVGGGRVVGMTQGIHIEAGVEEVREAFSRH